MPSGLLLVCAMCLPIVDAFAARTWVRSRQPLQLGLLPFPLEEALLPGETKQVHLYEARFIQLFADAAAQHDSCIGQLLYTNRGAVAITSLLEVEEFRKEEFGVWARLKCVGRVRLLSVAETDFQYALANVTLYYDGADDAEVAAASSSGELTRAAADAAARVLADAAAAASVSEAAVLEAANDLLDDQEDQLMTTHASVVDLQRRLRGSEVLDAPLSEDPEGRVEWGHELRNAESDQFTLLKDLVATRRDVLLSQGPDEPPLESLKEVVSPLWEVRYRHRSRIIWPAARPSLPHTAGGVDPPPLRLAG